MRCKDCPYNDYDRAENCNICRFGFEGEDSRGECGCRYNRKTLDKFNRDLIYDIVNEGQELMNYYRL